MPPPGATPAPARRNHVFGGKDTAVSAALVTRYVAIAKSQPELADPSAPGNTVRQRGGAA
jgi:hypothetical protein